MASSVRVWKLVKFANSFQIYSFRKSDIIFRPVCLIGSRHKSVVPISLESDQNSNIENGEDKLDFSNFERAFKAKRTKEIIQALAVYKLCSIDFLVNRNKEVSYLCFFLKICPFFIISNIT